MLLPPHPAIPVMPAAARPAVATSSRIVSHRLPAFPPAFLTRRILRVKPRGNRIMAMNISGSRPPPGPLRREAVAAPVVPTVSVVVKGAFEGTVRLLGAKLQVASVGNVPQLKLTVPVKPPVGVSVMTVLPVEPD